MKPEPLPAQSASPLYMTGATHWEDEHFNYVDWPRLIERVRKPVDLSHLNTKQAKNACPFVLPSDAPLKTTDATKAHDHFTLLIADLDSGDLSLTDAVARVKALGIESCVVYSTLSHRTTDPQKGYKGRRWRVLVELSEGISGALWGTLQAYMCHMLQGDNCALRSQQISYLPAIGQGGYESHIQQGRALDPNDTSHPFIHAAIDWDSERQAIQRLRQSDIEAAHRQASEALSGREYGGEGFTISHALKHLDARNEWLLLGATDHGRKGLLSPHSDSGLPGIRVFDDGRWVSFHGSDLQAGIGIASTPKGDSPSLACGDAFDVYAYREHGNNHKAALKALADRYDPQGQKQRQREFMQAQDQPGQETPLFTIEEGESALSLLTRFSLNGQSAEMEKQMANDVFVLGKLALLGQATVFYAPPNCGKTLITLKLLIDAVKDGVVDGSKCFYLNADDGQKGIVAKLKLAEQYGFHMLAPGQKGFKSGDLAAILQALTAKGEAHGAVLILDTLKKFTDLMDKQLQSAFLTVVREFTATGGTVIALAHTNKHRDGDGKLIHAGTADSVQDVDATYIVDLLKDDGGTRTVEFTNQKCRGDNTPKVAYRYEKSEGCQYRDILDSVVCIDDEELKVARKAAADRRKLDDDAETITAICEVLGDQTMGQTELLKALQADHAISRRTALDALKRYTGNNPFNMLHRWELVVGEKNAKSYRALTFGQKTPLESD